MENSNGSSVEELILLGLSEDPDVQIYLFILFLVVYAVTLTGNVLLITLWVDDQRLHTPMYFFLVNLALVDIGLSSVIVPNMLVQFLLSKRISYSGCVAQGYSALLFGITECVILAVMAYDRYVAISSPLRYTVIMSKYMCMTLAACCWMTGIFGALLAIVFVLQLTVCEYIINHVHCEITTFIKLACGDAFVTETVIFGLAMFVLPVPCFITVISYVCIIVAIVGIRSSEGRRKAFSTCSSHFIVVTMFYGNAIFHYLKPVSKNNENQHKVLSLFYTVAPPLLNPMIYSLRNKDVKMALLNIAKRNSIL